jgi:AbiV family abortive infection protein
MANQDFIAISEADCLILYKKVLKNSDNKWSLAESLASKKEYGFAIPTLIISIEELIKSIIILLDGNGLKFRQVKGVSIFFKNHQIRFIIAYLLLLINLFAEDLIKFIKLIGKDVKIVLDFQYSIIKNNDDFNKMVLYYIDQKSAALKIEFEYFSKLEKLRQEGFYCDYDDTFKNPLDINETDYNELYLRLSKVRKIGFMIIESYSSKSEESKLQIEMLKNTLKEVDFYNKFGDVLNKINKTKTRDPFDFIKSQL